MKSFISYPILFLLGLTLWFSSCQKEALLENIEMITPEEDKLQALIKEDTIVPLFQPDLIVSIKTNVTAMTSQCGPNLPDVSCYGQHSFNATAIVTNIGTADLPAGIVKVKWLLNNGSPFTQFYTHNGIPIGKSGRITRPYYLGPCDCSGPATYSIVTIDAEVDPNNEIAEKKENNNTATTYEACDGC